MSPGNKLLFKCMRNFYIVSFCNLLPDLCNKLSLFQKHFLPLDYSECVNQFNVSAVQSAPCRTDSHSPFQEPHILCWWRNRRCCKRAVIVRFCLFFRAWAHAASRGQHPINDETVWQAVVRVEETQSVVTEFVTLLLQMRIFLHRQMGSKLFTTCTWKQCFSCSGRTTVYVASQGPSAVQCTSKRPQTYNLFRYCPNTYWFSKSESFKLSFAQASSQ